MNGGDRLRADISSALTARAPSFTYADYLWRKITVPSSDFCHGGKGFWKTQRIVAPAGGEARSQECVASLKRP